MTATGGGTDGRKPARAPAGGAHLPVGEPTSSVSSLLRQLRAELVRRGRRRAQPLTLMAVGVGLAVLALVVGVGQVLGPDEATAGVASAQPTEAVEASEALEVPTPQPMFPDPDLAAPVVRPSAPAEQVVAPPVSIGIVDLGISQNLIGLRVSPDGTMQVPEEGEDIGWWAKGPAPGESGGAVIAGHVSLGGEPGVFGELDELEDGAQVVIDRSDGSRATYQVIDRQQFPKDDFPDELVYTFDGPTSLHLVTCGGEIDPATGHYKDNVVLFTELVSDTSPNATT